MNKYYDGTKLLNKKDINGNKPEIYICTSNRNAGKTTWFSQKMVDDFKEHHKKFGLVYRYNYELDDVSDKFFKDIGSLFFPNDVMTHKRRAAGIYAELYLNDEPCGYAITLNSADQLKKYSHLLSDIEQMLFDEFQSETNHYCPNEVYKFQSVHNSIARGQGKQTRYVPVYMVGNPITLINPHYVAMNISTRLKKETKFLRGDGFVLEQGFNESASTAMKESGFNKAYSTSRYNDYAQEGVYLNDSDAFIGTPDGKSNYICTLKYNGQDYGIREYPELGIVYINHKADKTFPYRVSVTTDDHQINYVMLKRNDYFLFNMRYYYEHGCLRFQDLLCKDAILTALSY